MDALGTIISSSPAAIKEAAKAGSASSGMDLISKVENGTVDLSNFKYDCRFMYQSGRTNEPEFARCDLAALQAEEAQEQYETQLEEARKCQDFFQKIGRESDTCNFDWRSMLGQENTDYINFANTKISKKTVYIIGGLAAGSALLIYLLAKRKKS